MKRRRDLLLMTAVALALCGACGVWLRVQQQQYARNRALIDALKHYDTETAFALVNAGADPNTRAEPSPAPSLKLLLAQLLRHAPAPADDSPTAFFLACGSGWVWQGKHGLYFTRCEEDAALVQAMLARRADLNAPVRDHYSALMHGIVQNRTRTVELLLTHGANVNEQAVSGWTPLIRAVRFDYPDMVRLLLAHGADVAIQDREGKSALRHAVLNEGDKNIIGQLLAHGADPNQSNKQGVTLLQTAQKRHRPDIVALLLRGGK